MDVQSGGRHCRTIEIKGIKMVAQTFVHEYEMDGIIRFGKRDAERISRRSESKSKKKDGNPRRTNGP